MGAVLKQCSAEDGLRKPTARGPHPRTAVDRAHGSSDEERTERRRADGAEWVVGLVEGDGGRRGWGR